VFLRSLSCGVKTFPPVPPFRCVLIGDGSGTSISVPEPSTDYTNTSKSEYRWVVLAHLSMCQNHPRSPTHHWGFLRGLCPLKLNRSGVGAPRRFQRDEPELAMSEEHVFYFLHFINLCYPWLHTFQIYCLFFDSTGWLF